MIFLFWILNFGISWLNAWGCGLNWAATKREGGWAHFMNWMGAIMAACGFTWCLLIALAFVGTAIPLSSSDPTAHTVYAVSPQMMLVMLKLGYTVIILPVLGSGLAITVESWIRFSRSRSFGDGAVAAYNTYAQIENMYDAVQLLPGFLGDIGDFFSSSGSSSSSDDDEGSGLGGLAVMIVVGLVALALAGGILLTRYIVLSTARRAVRMRSEGF